LSALASARPTTGPGTAVVHTAFGGFILGYDIDRNGTEGVLAESITQTDGTYDVAVETFDQSSGNIIKVLRHLHHTHDDFVTLGIVGTGVGLVEFEHSSGLFVDGRRYVTLNPLSANVFTSAWTPPIGANDLITSVSENQGQQVTAFLGFHNGGSNDTFLFTSNVGANTFGPFLTVVDTFFTFSNSPKMAIDRVKNQAVIGASNGCPNCSPRIAQIDLATGAETWFTASGFGYINGIAVDPATRTACTSTETDFHVEFYNLDTHAALYVPIPGAVSQAQSGQDVELDPIHGLFLVGQEFSSTAPSGSSIQVFDEQGNYVESINGLSLPASPALLALNPTNRTGFVINTPDLTSLQSFNY
jgi:hypothetical protein